MFAQLVPRWLLQQLRSTPQARELFPAIAWLVQFSTRW
jgi:hypothetical protein